MRERLSIQATHVVLRAVAEFREALRLDPALQDAADALASRVLKY